MVHAVVVREAGGPEVLKLEDRPVGAPGEGEILLRHEAIGLNFIDVYHRTGLYPNALPFVPGVEGAGVVTAVGAGVSEVAPGDRICYNGPLGAYAEQRVLPARNAIPVPREIGSATAAASILKGLTAYYLLHFTHRLQKGETILVHAAAGGVGLFLCQWANALGARVIGTAGGGDKAALAKSHGCDRVIDYRSEDFVERVREITDGKGVDVVYDSVGRDTFEHSLDCLKPRGLMVSYGSSTGPVEVSDLGILARKGSLYVTRPTLFNTLATREDVLEGASALFGMVRQGRIKVVTGQTFALSDVADAHRALESRQTIGSTVLLPS